MRSREAKWYFAAASAMFLILFAPGWAPDKFLFGLDTYTLHLPFLIYAKRVWEIFHDMPLWMPDIYMGLPMIDASNLMYFHPTSLLSIILPVPAVQSYLIDIILHMAAAGFGMYVFLKRHEIEKQAAYLGAFVFMLSGPLVTSVYSGHWPDIKALALVPFIFYFVNRAITEKSLFFFLTAGLFLAMQVTGLGMQIAAYTFMGITAYAAYLLYCAKAGKKEIKNTVLFFLIMAASTALFSAPQFFTSMDYMNFSWRKDFSYEEFVNYSFKPAESIVLLLPQFFGLKDGLYWGFMPGTSVSLYCGLLPLLLAPFAFITGRHRNISFFFAMLGAFFMLLAFGGYTPLYKLLHNIPVFNKFRNPGRAMYMMPFIFSFFSAAGLGAVLQRGETDKSAENIFKNLMKTVAAAAGLLIIAAAGEKFLKGVIAGMYVGVRGSMTNQPMPEYGIESAAGMIREDVLYFAVICMAFGFLIYMVFKNRLRSAFAAAFLLCLLQFFDMQRVDKKFISYESVENAAPVDAAGLHMQNDKTIFRGADFNFTWPINRSVYYNLEFFVGYHAIMHQKMYNLLGSEAFKYMNIMRLFNVKYYLSNENSWDYGDIKLKKVLEGPITLYEDLDVMPRAFLTDRIRKLPGDDEILEFMMTADFDPGEALVKDRISLAEKPGKAEMFANIIEYSPNRIKVATGADRETLLVLSNMYYHRWKVLVDKKPEKIYNIDYCINGVKLAAGSHELEFYYDRMFVVLCLLLMLAAFAAYAAVYLIEKRRSLRG